MELGYFKCHIQGYREEKYFETCSALDRAIAEIHPPEDNDNRHAMLTRTDAEEGDDNHLEYDFYSNEKDGQVMGSDIYIKIDDEHTSPYELASCPAERIMSAWGKINENNRIIGKVHEQVGGNIRLTYDWTQGKAIDTIGYLALAR